MSLLLRRRGIIASQATGVVSPTLGADFTTAASGGPGNQTSLDVDVPAGVQDGERLVVLLFSHAGAWDTHADFSHLSAAEINFTGGANRVRMEVQHRVASSEPASYTFTNGGGFLGAVMVRGIDFHPTSPFHVVATPASDGGDPASTTITYPDLTTTIDGCLILRATVASAGTRDFTTPAGHNELTEHESHTVEAATSFVLHYKTQETAGAVGTADTIIDTEVEVWGAVTIAVAPA